MNIYAKPGITMHIGRVGEHLANTVIFDISNWIAEYGSGVPELVINQSGESYPQKTTFENGIVRWEVTNSNTAEPVMGRCELFYLRVIYTQLTEKPEDWDINWTQYTDLSGNPLTDISAPNWIYSENDPTIPYAKKENQTIKSEIFDFIVTNSLDYEEGTEPPEPFESWMEELFEVAAEVKDAVTKIQDSKQYAEKAIEQANEAEAWAVGTVDGVPVDSTKEQYENNSKYWASQSKSDSDDAKIAKTLAENARDAAQAAQAISERCATQTTSDAAIAEAARIAAEGAQTIAENAQIAAENARIAAENAQSDAELARDQSVEYGTKPATPIGGTWWIWNATTKQYEDTKVKSVLSIIKVYPSKADMIADLGNRQEGDLVLIASGPGNPDDSDLYVHSGTNWTYLSNLSALEGVGIDKIERTQGTGAPGTTDTYTITLTDGRTYSFTVHQGRDGIDGLGDMNAADYDSDGAILAAGGIAKYVDKNSSSALLKHWTAADLGL